MKKYSWFVRHTAKLVMYYKRLHKKYSDDFAIASDIEITIILASIIIIIGELSIKGCPVAPVTTFLVTHICGWLLALFITAIVMIINFACHEYATYMSNVHNYLNEQKSLR